MPERKHRSSPIDDVDVEWPNSPLGPPILFTNMEIRRMLELAEVQDNDVFYDLGCGWGQNLLVAASEFGVRKCVGIERIKPRFLKAKERVRKWSLSKRVSIVHGDLEELIDGKLERAAIEEATIVLYALETASDLVERLSRKLKNGSRLVYYYHALFPEIMPDATDYPFFVSKSPFRNPTSASEWLRSIVSKKTSSFQPGSRPTVEELWEELRHDYDSLGLRRSDVAKYRRRLANVISNT